MFHRVCCALNRNQKKQPPLKECCAIFCLQSWRKSIDSRQSQWDTCGANKFESRNFSFYPIAVTCFVRMKTPAVTSARIGIRRETFRPDSPDPKRRQLSNQSGSATILSKQSVDTFISRQPSKHLATSNLGCEVTRSTAKLVITPRSRYGWRPIDHIAPTYNF